MKQVLKYIVLFYQKAISPIFPPSCRFHPTCSHYAIESLEKHGAFWGSLLAAKRIIRCNPFNPGGLDYVPDKINKQIILQFKNYNEAN